MVFSYLVWMATSLFQEGWRWRWRQGRGYDDFHPALSNQPGMLDGNLQVFLAATKARTMSVGITKTREATSYQSIKLAGIVHIIPFIGPANGIGP